MNATDSARVNSSKSSCEPIRPHSRFGLVISTCPLPPGQHPGQIFRTRPLTDLLTRPGETGETMRDTGGAQPGLCLVSETRHNAGDTGDMRRSAHNPEVEGSNPSPATKARGPFSNREGAFCM
jgi:hypothetical protein